MEGGPFSLAPTSFLNILKNKLGVIAEKVELRAQSQFFRELFIGVALVVYGRHM